MTNPADTEVSTSIALAATDKGPARADNKPAEKRPPEGEFKVVETRDDGTVIVEMSDGRMFPVPAFGEDKPRKGAKVSILADGVDKDGVPLNPTAKLL